MHRHGSRSASNVLSVAAAALEGNVMAIDQRATISGQADVAIHATLEKVWQIHTDIDGWSEWNGNVQSSKLDGPLAVGSVFRWRSGGVPIASTLDQVEPLHLIAWSGKAMGTRASHTWIFDRRDDVVIVSTWESFEGWLPRFFPAFFRRVLRTTLQSWLESLKRQAEASDGLGHEKLIGGV